MKTSMLKSKFLYGLLILGIVFNILWSMRIETKAEKLGSLLEKYHANLQALHDVFPEDLKEFTRTVKSNKGEGRNASIELLFKGQNQSSILMDDTGFDALGQTAQLRTGPGKAYPRVFVWNLDDPKEQPIAGIGYPGGFLQIWRDHAELQSGKRGEKHSIVNLRKDLLSLELVGSGGGEKHASVQMSEETCSVNSRNTWIIGGDWLDESTLGSGSLHIDTNGLVLGFGGVEKRVTIKMDKDGIHIGGEAGINIKSKGDINIKSTNGQVNINGKTIHLNE